MHERGTCETSVFRSHTASMRKREDGILRWRTVVAAHDISVFLRSLALPLACDFCHTDVI